MYTIEDIIKHQLIYFHGPERVKYRNIPKVMDLCLSKLQQLIDGDHFSNEEILESFILVENVRNKFEFDTELEKLKEDINNGEWVSLINNSIEPKVISQLFLDFCENLSSPIISIENLREVGNTYKQSFSKFSSIEESKDKKALHEIFEDEYRVNAKKVTYQII